MESYEVMKSAVAQVGAKAVAADMSLSASMIYKWCEPSEGPDAAGADNPLDRLERIREITGETGPIEWLCEKAGGFFVENAKAGAAPEASLFNMTHRIVKEFSEMLHAVSNSMEDDQRIDEKEAAKIRKEWEQLKRVGEAFVTACERGGY